MSIAEELVPRLPGETEADWRERVAREVADTELVVTLLEIAAGRPGVTEAERMELRARIDLMTDEDHRQRARAMLDVQPASPPPGSTGH